MIRNGSLAGQTVGAVNTMNDPQIVDGQLTTPGSRANLSEPSTSSLHKFKEGEVPDTSCFSTFPTNQVPQSVQRDTITAKTTVTAALTDLRGSACLPQSAPTVQAQVLSTGCASCDDCTHVNLKEHNQVEAQREIADVSWAKQGTGAGLPAAPAAPRKRGNLSVIDSSSCSATLSRNLFPLLIEPNEADNYNAKLNNKTQSVNVTSRNNCISNKGNDNRLLSECKTAVTVPNIKPQRNIESLNEATNNNSDKLAKNNGALNLSNWESQSQCRFNKIPEYDIPEESAKQLLLKSDQKEWEESFTCKSTYNDTTQLFLNIQRFMKQQGFKLGLFGGGENSLSTGTTGWGTPPNANSNNAGSNSAGWGSNNAGGQGNSVQQQWNNNANRSNASQQPPPPDGNSNKSSNPNSSLQSGAQQPPSQPNNQGNQGSTPSQAGTPIQPTTKQQLEQLNNMREALLSQDGWGGQHVNQDTNWDIPSSPEPSIKIDSAGPPQWKPNINNGTELWEANLRNGGQPPPQPAQKVPWGHTPSTNIGGTWGEDDDSTDSSNVWTGPPGAGGGGGQQQWGSNANSAMWGASGPKKESEWTGNAGWTSGDCREGVPRSALMPRDVRDARCEIRGNASEALHVLDPRDQVRLVAGDMRGDPRGITGRLNGAGTDGMWNQPPQGSHHMHQSGKMMGPTGWEEPSPPSQRRNVPNYDDGTSLWGNPGQQQNRIAGGMGRGAGAMTCPPGMAQSRSKPEGGVWGHGAARNGSWEENAHAGWDESGKWTEGGGGAGGGPWPAKSKPGVMAGPLWDSAGEMDWGPHKVSKQLTKEIIWNSKPFRVLIEMGYKKEDAEHALRLRDMNVDEAIELLTSMRGNMDGWRGRHEDHFDHQGYGQFSGQRFGPSGPSTQMPFPQGGNGPNILAHINNSTSSSNLPMASVNSQTAAIMQKMLNHPGSSFSNGASGGTRSVLPQSQPSTQQLRMLVSQIQLAVQAGYLNHQILNQPLAPQTLVLLNQLLQQIKNLQQLLSQHTAAQTQGPPGKQNSMISYYSAMVTKTKQQIHSLQTQIANHQAVYVKQQVAGGGNPGVGNDFFKPNVHDSVAALQGNFGDLSISKEPQSTQQSRLNQWKLPSVDKDSDAGNEFSRAPGSVAKPLVSSHSSPNMNQLGLTQSDGTGDASGWPESGASGDVPPDAAKDGQWAAPSQASLTDLVPEFEPGKPWKGTQIKSIEDDPSITPGSVARSPLSLVAIKDSEIFNTGVAPPKVSPPGDTNLPPLSLVSSTWSFNPPSSTPSSFTSPLSKLAQTKGAWGEGAPPPTPTSELWAAPINKSRGPPPGLAKGASAPNISSNGWRGSATNWGSPWLFLRNLTAQIDGSTLKTLCIQHGPLQSFHLYLHHGFALAKYSTREEATKAQTALNNCVLGNTTILAECPAETDVNTLLQQMAPQQGTSAGGWRSSGKQQPPPPQAGADTWSTAWPQNASSASLWGNAPMDSAEQARTTPSSLNSFLPGDLLGGESM